MKIYEKEVHLKTSSNDLQLASAPLTHAQTDSKSLSNAQEHVPPCFFQQITKDLSKHL